MKNFHVSLRFLVCLAVFSTFVITSYSIHYTKLYDEAQRKMFGKALQSASLTTELQRPRMETLAKVDKQAPEKYRILSKLASQGLNVEEIATILGVSRVEAHQLINLSSVAQMRQGL